MNKATSSPGTGRQATGEPTPPRRMEQVNDDGPVRRIVFEDDQPERMYRTVQAPAPEPEPTPEPEPEPEREMRPARSHLVDRMPRRTGRWSIEEIHYEVDHLNRRRHLMPADVAPRPARTVYKTERSYVRETRFHGSEGDRRLLYVSPEDRIATGDRRFVSSQVDRILRRDGPTPSERLMERAARPWAPSNGLAPATETSEADDTPSKRKPRKAKGKAKAPKAPKAPEATKAKVEVEVDNDLQPQCCALTADGVQCRNSSRKNSKYCGAHRGYRPRGSPAIKHKLDTLPVHQGAQDTVPTLRKKAKDTRSAKGTKSTKGARSTKATRKTTKKAASKKGKK